MGAIGKTILGLLTVLAILTLLALFVWIVMIIPWWVINSVLGFQVAVLFLALCHTLGKFLCE